MMVEPMEMMPEAREQAALAPEQLRSDKLKILVIDDEPVNTALFEAILADEGYGRVKAINDSRTALEVCRAFAPDLILLDLMMPHVDGISILRSLRAEQAGVSIPVMVLTADETRETKLKALEVGATDFVLKPFDLPDALRRIEHLLALRQEHLRLAHPPAARAE